MKNIVVLSKNNKTPLTYNEKWGIIQISGDLSPIPTKNLMGCLELLTPDPKPILKFVRNIKSRIEYLVIQTDDDSLSEIIMLALGTIFLETQTSFYRPRGHPDKKVYRDILNEHYRR